MDFANVCPTEHSIALLLELLVDPKLPATPIARGAPSKEDQESVGKQVHAVVLLYNYYYRKLHPQLEFLSFENFCKLAVTSRPTLAAYLGVMKRSHETETLQLSLTEEKIMSACQISMGLDASKKVPSMDGWPVSKIAVFLVDSKKENCLVQFGSITQGVWSVIEKDVDVPIGSSESPSDSNHVYKKKRVVRKSLKDKLCTDEPALQQLAFLAVKEAIVSLKFGIDINQNDLLVLESHLSYSTSKEKAAARFYIMQCTQANNDGAMQCPIKDVINSLQGPFLIKESVGWMYTAPVEYFHLLPYAEMLSDWFSSLQGPFLIKESVGWMYTALVKYFHLLPYAEMLSDWFSSIVPSNSVPQQRRELEIVKVDSHEAHESCEPEVSKVFEGPRISGAEIFGSKTGAGSLKQDDKNGNPHRSVVSDSPKQNDSTTHSGNKVHFHLPKHNDSNAHPGSQVASHLPKNSCISADNGGNIISDSPRQSENVECYLVDMNDDTDGSRNMEVDDFASVLAEGRGKSKNISSGVQAESCGKMTSFVDQTKVVDSLISARFVESKGGDVGIVNKEQNNISSDLDKMRNHDHATIICQSNTNTSVIPQSTARDCEQVHAIIAANDKEITRTAVNAILSKRDELSFQLRDLEDQIAHCDKDIQTVLNGGEGCFTLKFERLIEVCSRMSLRADRGRYNQHGVDHCSPQSAKRKRLSDTVVNLQNPCEDLDNVCLENEWILPTYRVWAQDGGIQANVTLKDMKSERNMVGDVRPLAREARESAAAKMLGLLAAPPKFTADRTAQV